MDCCTMPCLPLPSSRLPMLVVARARRNGRCGRAGGDASAGADADALTEDRRRRRDPGVLRRVRDARAGDALRSSAGRHSGARARDGSRACSFSRAAPVLSSALPAFRIQAFRAPLRAVLPSFLAMLDRAEPWRRAAARRPGAPSSPRCSSSSCSEARSE